MADRSGEVRDVRSRNRGIKIAILAVIILLILIGIGLALYFFVFSTDTERLEFIPESDNGVLISYNASDSTDGEKWAVKIDRFLESYIRPPGGETTACTSDYIKHETAREIPCKIDVSTLQECSSANSRYGYLDGRGTPCVIVKVKKAYNWEPISYTDPSEAENSTMPSQLVEYIKYLNTSTIDVVKRKLNTTWITCAGENDEDKQSIGSLRYFFPGINMTSQYGGIPNMFFPYLEQDAYLEPFLFVKFVRPARNTTVHVKCQAWAKNLEPEEGTVNFELKID